MLSRFWKQNRLCMILGDLVTSFHVVSIFVFFVCVIVCLFDSFTVAQKWMQIIKWERKTIYSMKMETKISQHLKHKAYSHIQTKILYNCKIGMVLFVWFFILFFFGYYCCCLLEIISCRKCVASRNRKEGKIDKSQ